LNAPPLRKKNTTTGTAYVRFPDVEHSLSDLYALSDEEIIARCELPKGAPGFVETQCVVHFLRRRRHVPKTFEPLFQNLQRRVRRIRLSQIDPDYDEHVREGAFDRFNMLVASESKGYNERLDIFEVNFRGGYASLMLDELNQRTAHAQHFAEKADVNDDDETYIDDGTDPDTLFRNLDFARRWKVWRECMTLRQRSAVKLALRGTPVESAQPGHNSISSLLGVTPKTIRSDLKKAHALFKSLK